MSCASVFSKDHSPMTHGYLWLIIGSSNACRSDTGRQVQKHETSSAAETWHCCHVKIKTPAVTLMDVCNRRPWCKYSLISKAMPLKQYGSYCSRVLWTPTSTTAVIVVMRGGIVVVSAGTFGGSSSWRLVLYYDAIGHMSQHQSYVQMATYYILTRPRCRFKWHVKQGSGTRWAKPLTCRKQACTRFSGNMFLLMGKDKIGGEWNTQKIMTYKSGSFQESLNWYK